MLKKVITHNGSFHSDDVFAVATLQLFFGVENIEVIRTRDETVITSGDIVVDVGGVYDPAQQRFDHHQNGSPVRDNGIPYAAFGLVWKQYGEKVSGSKEAAEIIERRLVVPIDAVDNGISLYDKKMEEFSPVTINDIVSFLRPVWNSTEDLDESFNEVCNLARQLLDRAIKHAKADLAEQTLVRKIYETATDKRIIVSEVPISDYLLTDYSETLFLVHPRDDGNWKAVAVRVGYDSFETKVSFPEKWRGLRDEELAKVSDVGDAIFCHKTGYLFVGASKEGVLEAVNKALGQ